MTNPEIDLDVICKHCLAPYGQHQFLECPSGITVFTSQEEKKYALKLQLKCEDLEKKLYRGLTRLDCHEHLEQELAEWLKNHQPPHEAKELFESQTPEMQESLKKLIVPEKTEQNTILKQIAHIVDNPRDNLIHTSFSPSPQEIMETALKEIKQILMGTCPR